ncbi:hypothetical protein BDV95DRAFT_262480 [Massariosphaeria phaeospora]|uniref:Uncharacterized protein n=1 Tax=Massariosphaeria phaeospora TaxID=100035 RepID=A0A7C8M0J9_9PLEO|nr:hypothetical protein BDV95DRAFT_262480 [Massariosphaeria phaeospora]
MIDLAFRHSQLFDKLQHFQHPTNSAPATYSTRPTSTASVCVLLRLPLPSSPILHASSLTLLLITAVQGPAGSAKATTLYNAAGYQARAHVRQLVMLVSSVLPLCSLRPLRYTQWFHQLFREHVSHDLSDYVLTTAVNNIVFHLHVILRVFAVFLNFADAVFTEGAPE